MDKEISSTASGDQNKIYGKLVASGRAGWKKYGTNKSDQGYVFNSNNGFNFRIAQTEIDELGVTMDAIQDCVDQLEKMGDAAALKKAMSVPESGDFKNGGLVITSKEDPRIKMMVTLHNPDYEDTDVLLGFFLDNENIGAAMDDDHKDHTPEREVEADEMGDAHVAAEQEKTKLESALSEEEILLGLTESVEIETVADKIKTDHSRYLREDDAMVETGEADQDYDHKFYDAIAGALKKKGYSVTHQEFDKYQGVFLNVSKGNKSVTIMTKDLYVTGKPKKSSAKYKSAQLVGPEMDVYSANKGDYFQLKPNHVFKDHDLLLVGLDGSSKTIHNPKVSDLPDLNDVQSGIEYHGQPDNVAVMFVEGDEENEAHVKVSADYKKVDLDGLDSIVSNAMGGPKKEDQEQPTTGGEEVSNERKSFTEGVDFWGIPLVEEVKPMKAGSSIGDKGKKVGTGLGEKGAAKPTYAKDVKKFDSEVDGKAADLKGKDVDKATPVGKSIGPKGAVVGKEVGEKEHNGADAHLGDAKDGIGDVMRAKGKSASQEKTLEKSAVKPGRIDAKPRPVSESEEGDEEKKAGEHPTMKALGGRNPKLESYRKMRAEAMKKRVEEKRKKGDEAPKAEEPEEDDLSAPSENDDVPSYPSDEC